MGRRIRFVFGTFASRGANGVAGIDIEGEGVVKVLDPWASSMHDEDLKCRFEFGIEEDGESMPRLIYAFYADNKDRG